MEKKLKKQRREKILHKPLCFFKVRQIMCDRVPMCVRLGVRVNVYMCAYVDIQYTLNAYTITYVYMYVYVTISIDVH